MLSHFSCVWLCVVLWTVVAHNASLSMGFSRQAYWSALPFLPPRDLPNPEPTSHLLFVVQFLSHVWFFGTAWTAVCQASLSFTNSQSLLKLVSMEWMMPSNHLVLCHTLLLLPSIFTRIRVFSNQSALHIRWPKIWSFSFGISPSNEYSGLISFRIGWFGLLATQGTLNSWVSSSNYSESFELALNMWSLPQSPFRFFHKHLMKNPHGLFGQPNSFRFHPL